MTMRILVYGDSHAWGDSVEGHRTVAEAITRAVRGQL